MANKTDGSASPAARSVKLQKELREENEGADKGSSPYFSRAVGKALELLEILKSQNTSMTLNEVTKRLDLTKSSAFRLLETLTELTYIQHRIDGYYEISNQHRVSVGTQVRESLLRLKLPVLRKLQEEFQETVSVAVLFTNHIEVVRVIESNQVVRMVNTVGRILSPHASSLGKAITAFQSEEVRRHLLTSYGLVRFTPATITDETLLRAELDGIRATGIALEKEESTAYGYCFGAPLFQIGESAVGAISISLPKSRVPSGDVRFTIVHSVQKAAATISDDLRRIRG